MISEFFFFKPTKKVHTNPALSSYKSRKICIIGRKPKLKLDALLFPARRDQKQGLLLHFHGNRGNLSYHFPYSAWFSSIGLSSLIFDYPGFGESEGKFNWETIDRACIRAWNYISSTKEDYPIFLFGQSMGAFLLLKNLPYFKPRKRIGGIILEGGFSDTRLLAADHLKRKWFLSPFADSISLLTSEKVNWSEYPQKGFNFPFLVIHNTDDRIVPFKFGQTLFDHLPGENKVFWQAESKHGTGSMHVDAFSGMNLSNRFLAQKWIKSLLDGTYVKADFDFPAFRSSIEIPQGEQHWLSKA